MRPRIFLVLAGIAAVVIAICELESLAAMNRWDPTDVGRRPDLSLYLWPRELDELLADENALITVRVEAAGAVRTYRYSVRPDEGELDDLLLLEDTDEDEEIALAADELAPAVADAGL